MAWIDKKQRRDGGVSARVVWRLGGARDGAYQSETFSAGTDAVNMERARGFKSMVDAAGQRWPEVWVRGEEYVRQIVDLSPGQRKRYLGQLRVLASTRVQGELVFTKSVTSTTEPDLRAWLLTWDRSMKTKSNYHGLIHGVFAYAIAQGWLSVSPTARTALRGSRVRQSRPELRFLTEADNGDFHTHVWRKLMKALAAEGIAPFRFHDLRHTHVAWLVAGGAPLPHIQARLGHESITTTIDTYGRLLPAGDELISDIIDTALSGGVVRPSGYDDRVAISGSVQHNGVSG